MTLARDTTYNIVGAAVPVAVSMITVPLYIEVVGLERYGVLGMCWLLIGYFNFFDFGIGRAIAKHIANLQNATATLRSEAFWTGATLSVAFAVLATLTSAIVAALSIRFMTFQSATLFEEVYLSLPLLILAVPISIIQAAFRGSLEGRRRFLITNLLTTIGTVATAILPLASTFVWGPHLFNLIAVTVIVRLGLMIALIVASARAVPLERYKSPDFARMKEMMRFGGWLTISALISPVLVLLDRFLIGAMLGGVEAALYIIPFNLVGQMLLFPYSLSAALFPRLAGSLGGDAEAFHQRTVEMTLYIVSAASIAMMVVVGPFLDFWIGRSNAVVATPIAVVLVVGFWANALAQLPVTRLQALGRADLIAKIHVAECVPYILILWLLLMQFGVIGAAMAWSIRVVVDFLALATCDRLQTATLKKWLVHGLIIVALAILLLTGVADGKLHFLIGALAGGVALSFIVVTAPRHLISKFRSEARAILRRSR